MNTNPNAKRILCYGDSNTEGIIPGDVGRFPANIRWTGILQKELGNDYEIIEEGLWGRNTNMDDWHPDFEDKNGKTYLYPCLRSQFPIDYFILWLGTVDLKKYFKRNAQDAAKGIEELIEITKGYTPNTKIILVSPLLVLDKAIEVKPHFEDAPEKSKHMAKEYEKVAKKFGCEFVNMANHVTASDVDGLHLDKESHTKIGKLFAETIRKMEKV